MPSKTKTKLVGIPTADGKFRCIWCPKTYCKSKHARRHMLLHTGERPYDCPHCSMNFTRADIRKRHVIKCALKQDGRDAAPVVSVAVPEVQEVQSDFPDLFEPADLFDDDQTETQNQPQTQTETQAQVQTQHQHQTQNLSLNSDLSHDTLSTLDQNLDCHMNTHTPQPSYFYPSAYQQPVYYAPETKVSSFPMLEQHATLYAHDDHVNLANLIDSLSQSALPVHYQLLNSDTESIESISESSASEDGGELFDPINWSLEGLF